MEIFKDMFFKNLIKKTIPPEEKDGNCIRMDSKSDDEDVESEASSSATEINQSDAISNSSSESPCPSGSQVPHRSCSPWRPRSVGPPNQSTVPASVKMSSNDELSIPSPPKMQSSPIPPWQTSPAAFVGYRYRMNADRGFAASK